MRRAFLTASAALPLLATARPASGGRRAAKVRRRSTGRPCAIWRASLSRSPTRRRTPLCRRRSRTWTFTAYQGIRFDPANRCGRGQGRKFTAQFFHRGYIYHDRVDIFEVADGKATPIRYTAPTCSRSRRCTQHRRSRFCRVSHPLSAEPPGRAGRGLRVSRRQLLPCHRQGPGLRAFGPRPGDQDGRCRRRGVSGLSLILAGAPGDRAPTSS